MTHPIQTELKPKAWCCFLSELLGADTNWKQTSYNGNMRGNYQVLYTYMSNVATMGVGSTDIFIAQQPYASWTVGVNTAQWYSPLGDACSD